MESKSDETFGQRVARLRAAAELTQDQLAEKAGLPVTSLRNYEHDHRRPRADAALALARALGVTVEELLAAPSDREARAKVQDAPKLRALKRAWQRASQTERRQFLNFVAEEGNGSPAEEGDAARAASSRPARSRGGSQVRKRARVTRAARDSGSPSDTAIRRKPKGAGGSGAKA